MRRSLVVMMVASLPGWAWGLEGVEAALHSQSQAAVAATAVPPARGADAPFRLRRDPMPELALREELSRRGPQAACENATELCYDLAEGRMVYRGARVLMPSFDGLRAENVSLRHDRIVFKYSFR